MTVGNDPACERRKARTMAKRTRRTLIVSKPTLDAALSEPGGLNKLMDKAPEVATVMYAIETTYHGPTNTKGARISVKIADGRKSTAHCPAAMSIPYDHTLSGPENHRAACVALLTVCHPSGVWVAGETRKGYVFTMVPGTVLVHGYTLRPALTVEM